jgi:hypothetical protein
MLIYNAMARAHLRRPQDECVDQRRFVDRAVRAVDRIAVEADELIELIDRQISLPATRRGGSSPSTSRPELPRDRPRFQP